jgi:small-conductance mechanosensitive channel
MTDLKHVFHKISYLQYPLLVAAMFFSIKPYIVGFDTVLENFNYTFTFAGLAISLSTLQDTSKTQNEFSKKIWEHPKKGKMVLIFLSAFTLFLIVLGTFGILGTHNQILQHMGFGILIFGIGMVGLLKTAIEMFENHRVDKVANNKIAHG